MDANGWTKVEGARLAFVKWDDGAYTAKAEVLSGLRDVLARAGLPVDEEVPDDG